MWSRVIPALRARVLEGPNPARDDDPAWKIPACMTTVPAPGDEDGALPAGAGTGLEPMTTAEIVDWARQRCGRGEEIHAVLKHDMAIGILPSGRLGATGVRVELAVAAITLTALLTRVALPET